jgi:uncharacterized membrane protein
MSSHAPNAFVAGARRVYQPIGFAKGYNFTLFCIFGGALLGFTFAHLRYLSRAIFCGDDGTIPGECYSYNSKRVYDIGIRIHLYTILPAALLAFLQFIPALRRRVPLFHRLNGYVSIVLSVVASAGSFMIAPIAFGGSLETRLWIGVSTIMFLGSLGMGVYNIKRMQIEQHRAWMLRAWFYAGSIITIRLIGIIGANIVSTGAFEPIYQSMPCSKIHSLYDGKPEKLQEMLGRFPVCENIDAWASVKADMNGKVENIAAALLTCMSMAGWLALALHAFGVEVYLRLTPAEFERLREISYQRQIEKGFKNPGSAGLTIDRLGDSEKWVPSSQKNGVEHVSKGSS